MHEVVTVGQSMKLWEELERGTPAMHEDLIVGQSMKLWEE